MDSNRRSALVTGASGVLGSQIVRRLVDEGWAVRVLTRRRVPQPFGVDTLVGDVCDPAVVARSVDAVDVIFHAAAVLRAPGGNVGEMRRVNIEGGRMVARMARSAGVGRLVALSSTAVYGDTRGRTVDEETPAAPTSPYGCSKLEAEAGIRSESPSAVILRVAAVYGPSTPGNYLRLAKLCRYGLRLTSDIRRTLVHEADFLRAAVDAALHPAAAGQVFNVTDGSTHTVSGITAVMAAALRNIPAIRVPLPSSVLRHLASMSDHQADAFRALAEDSAVAGTLLGAVTGYAPAVVLSSGMQAAIAVWRRDGLL